MLYKNSFVYIWKVEYYSLLPVYLQYCNPAHSSPKRVVDRPPFSNDTT